MHDIGAGCLRAAVAPKLSVNLHYAPLPRLTAAAPAAAVATAAAATRVV